MKRKEAAPVFKPYVMNQISLIPPSYGELIQEKHLVEDSKRGKSEKIDLPALLRQYKGGGYEQLPPKKWCKKVLVYAYCEKILFLQANSQSTEREYPIHVDQWRKRTRFPGTINAFRSKSHEAGDRWVFTAVLEYLVDGGYVKFWRTIFWMRTKIAAILQSTQSGMGKTVMKIIKNGSKSKSRAYWVRSKKANETENDEYGEDDLEELGGNSKEDINSERLKKKIDELNQRLREKVQKKRNTPGDEETGRRLPAKVEEVWTAGRDIGGSKQLRKNW